LLWACGEADTWPKKHEAEEAVQLTVVRKQRERSQG
jgi:hypothetical protein